MFGDEGTLRKDVRYFEVFGGRRSAKSYDVVQTLALTAMQEPYHFIPVVRKVATTLKDSVEAELLDFFNRNEIEIQRNKSEREITLPNGSRFRAFGLDDPRKLKSLKAATIIWAEEADELEEEDFDSLDAGLSPVLYPGRIVLTHNPFAKIPGSQHWIEKRFLHTMPELGVPLIDREANALVLRTWYKNNAFCPEATRKVLEGYAQTNPEKYKMWALGEFVALEGAVFKNWDVVQSVPSYADDLGVGLDYGFANDPAAALRVYAHNDELWLKGLLYKTDLTNPELINELRRAGVMNDDLITPDSAEPKSNEDLRRAGFRCVRPVKKRAGYKEDLVNRIRGFKIHLVAGDIDLKREFSTYSWSRDKNGKILPKLQDGEDHYMDALIMRMHDYYQNRAQTLPSVSAADLGL